MSDLYDVQMCGYAILKDVTKLCDEHGLHYFLSSGTLLGAVRHKGFIPWDNDIDIEMPVEDYRKFLKLAPKYLDSNLFLQTYQSDHSYNEMWAKVRRSGTTSLPLVWKNLNMHWGIGIDIFPLVGVYQNAFLAKLQKKLLSIDRAMLSKEFVLATSKDAINHKLRLLYLLPRGTRSLLCKLFERIIFKNFKKSKQVAMVYTNFCPYIKREAYDPIEYLQFECSTFSVPGNWDYVLKTYYGDYMTPPPESERNGHEGLLGKIIYDVNKGFQEYQQELTTDSVDKI